MSTNNTPLKYRAYIDGLRALAVLPVLFFHAELGFSGGYVGVDIFFVISGYLITALILKDLDSGKFSILDFWERRIRRILPALAVVVISCLVAGWFLYLPLDFKELGQSVIAQAALVSNIYFWRQSGYFEQAVEVKPLLHTWSLAVEEQFYLFFPCLLIACRRFSRNSIIPTILILFAGSYGLSVWGSHYYPQATFYLLPTRAWELLMGSFLAAIPAQRTLNRWLTESLSWGGLLAILWAVFFYDRDTRFPGTAAILPCAGAAFIIWANGRDLTAVGKLLALRPVVFIGLISYSLYLWHWPVLVFAQYWTVEPLSPGLRILLLLVCLVLAVLSWRFVETPFRKRVIFDNRNRIFAFGGITTASCMVVGFAIHHYRGAPSRLPANALQYAAGADDFALKNEVSLKNAVAGNFMELGAGDKQQPIGVLVWGDSHAMAALPVIDVLCKEYAVRGIAATHSSTAPLVGYQSQVSNLKNDCIPFNDAVMAFIRSNRVRDVVLIAAWGSYLTRDKTPQLLRSGMQDTIDALLGADVRIWIMRDVPIPPWNVPKTMASVVWQRRGNPEQFGLSLADHRKEFQRQNPVFEGLATKAPGVTILDPTTIFVGQNQLCRVEQNGKCFYSDSEHLTTPGAMILRPLLEPLFNGMISGRSIK
jgi:peptidoglycan/LPS O-acetylase OafA/YrhL